MREFHADPIALEPADGAIDRAVVAKVQLEAVPEVGLEVARDHRAAARKIDQLNLELAAVVGRADLLVRQPVAIFVASIGLAGFLACDRDAVERIRFRALRFLGLDDGRLFLSLAAAKDLRPDIHQTPLRLTSRARTYGRIRVTEWCAAP